MTDDPAKLFALTKQGRDGLMRLDRDAAEACFQQALAEAPDFVDAHVGLGQVAYERGDVAAARGHFVQAAKLAQRQCGGTWPARLRFTDERERAFLRAIHGLGLVAYRTGDLTAARQHFALEQRLDPADHQGSRYVLKNIADGKPWRVSSQ